MFLRIRNFRARLLICVKFLVTILMLHFLELIVIYSVKRTYPVFDLHQCYLDELPGLISERWSSNDGNKSITLEDILLSDIKPTPGRTIFFLETKCESSDTHSKYIINLTARQACSIESAALNNPNFQIYVLFANPKVVDQENHFINIIRSYKNVHLRQVNIWRYVKNTPVENWIIRDNKFLSMYPTEQTSDLLRLLTLYRFGGIYLDLDVVVLRSMENVPLNYVGAGLNNVVFNGVISLEPTGIGHEIGELFLRDFQQNFNGSDYIFNGPSLLERVLSRICGTKSVKEMLNNPRRCHGFRIFDPSAFYILQNLTYFFDPKMLDEAMELSKNSYLIHVFNSGSKGCLLKVGSNTAYGKYAQQHCPKTYAAAGQFF